MAIVDAATAERWGFLERVVPPGELDAAVDIAIEAILANDDAATRAQKRLQAAYEDLPMDEAVRRSIDAFAACYASGTPQRLMAGFAAHRAKR